MTEDSKAKARACDARYRERNREKLREKNKLWRLENLEKAKTASREWKDKNKDRVKASVAEYRAKNPVKVALFLAKYNLSEKAKELSRLKSINKRALKKVGGGKLSKDITGKLLTLQRGLCPCCMSSLSEVGFHIDHIYPLSRGGAHCDSNVQLLCPPCNQSKHAKDPLDFMQSRGFLI